MQVINYAAFAVKIYHCMTSACMLYTTILSCKKAHKPVKIIALKAMKIYLCRTIGRPIRVRAFHVSIRIWDIPYAYGTTYAYRAEHMHLYLLQVDRAAFMRKNALLLYTFFYIHSNRTVKNLQHG